MSQFPPSAALPLPPVARRGVLRAAAVGAGGALIAPWIPAWAASGSGGIAAALPTVSGEDITLTIARQSLVMDGRRTAAIGINGTVPAPLIRLREGQTVRLTVRNALAEASSLHWHGLLVPARYDGVPGISFPGIAAGAAFTYEFPIRQAGTYWYHSHSGLQEQLGLYGPIVIDPATADPIAAEREHIIVLSDHSALSPGAIMRSMKLNPGGFNFQKQTIAGRISGRDQPGAERLRWGAMRMDPADISDATGAIYTYLVNGYGPRDNWTGLYTPGERVRLRVINASSMTTFNVRIPGLALSVVQADGMNVRPVTVDEFQIGVAETYDVVVTPSRAQAWTIVGEASDRSGMARATLAPAQGMQGDVPALRPRPLATMQDMGMTMDGDMAGMDMSGSPGRGTDPTAEQNDSARLATSAAAVSGVAAAGGAAMDMSHAGTNSGADHAAMDHGAMGHGDMAAAPGEMTHSMDMRDFSNAPQVRKGPGVQTISPMPTDRTGEPGQGLDNVGHRVLTYRDLVALVPNPDVRAPARQLDIHLTGNMERFMWGFDGVKMSETMEPLAFTLGERVRVRLVNDTMMAHPIHLHGHFFELVTGHGDHAPRKHTVIVQPGGTVTWDFTADAIGDWAFHCHLLYHMASGMMRTVSVRERAA